MFYPISTRKAIAGARAALLAIAFLALAACDGAAKILDATSNGSAPTANIVDTAVEAGSFNTLVAALRATGLDAVLADDDATFTVFAPTDDAFAALGSDTVNSLLADPDALRSILLYHVMDSAVDSQTAISLAGSSVPSVNGETLSVSLNDGSLFINNAQVTTADVNASNGVIHVIDTVLIPGQGNDAGGAGNGDSGTGNGDSDAGSGDSDAGDSDAGGTDDGNGAAAGGNTDGAGEGGDGGQNGDQDNGESNALSSITDTAVAAGSFNTLVAALQATGLDSVLADESQHFTVFAPTDDAFAALGQDTINALLADTDTLKDILLYHVISGTAVDAKTAVGLAGTKVTAANDSEFALSLNDGALFVNLSEVVATDVFASNGVIHVIDTVLTPPAPVTASGSVVDVAITDGRFNTLVAALQATGLDTVLADHDGVFTVFAPTDEAFAKLGNDTINALLGDLPTLSNILLTHVISGATVDSVSAFAASGGTVETASGTEVTLSIRDGALFVNDSKVIITDIKAENGIIHVIDTVIQ